MASHISILVAEDNDISRELMCKILQVNGYNTIEAIDGDEAINAVSRHSIDLALVDLNMEPRGGFEFVKYLVTSGVKIPVIIVTADTSSDILLLANELGVQRVLQKPVDPDKLKHIVEQTLKRNGHVLDVMGRATIETKFSHEDLLRKAISIAERNVAGQKGGPFGAVVADDEGLILGEGANGITSRLDPMAHAEVLAIRKAAEKLGQLNLDGCVLYCSSEPTMVGQALIRSVGITDVYFGLSHDDINEMYERERDIPDTKYTKICHDEAMMMFKSWQRIDQNNVE